MFAMTLTTYSDITGATIRTETGGDKVASTQVTGATDIECLKEAVRLGYASGLDFNVMESQEETARYQFRLYWCGRKRQGREWTTYSPERQHTTLVGAIAAARLRSSYP